MIERQEQPRKRYHPSEVHVPRTPSASGKGELRVDGWRWMSQALFKIATVGCSLQYELIRCHLNHLYLNPSVPMKSETRRVRRAIKRLMDLGLIQIWRETFFNNRVGFEALTLTSSGRAFCELWGWGPVETDWDRLARGHQAEGQVKHAIAVLVFAMQARVRGWKATILPRLDHTERLPFYEYLFDPDVLVEKGSSHTFVEVETAPARHKETKWGMSAAVQNYVAVCALTPRRRESLENEIRGKGYRFSSTDLSTLTTSYKLNPNNPCSLWVKQT